MCSILPLNSFNCYADGSGTEAIEGMEAEGLIFSHSLSISSGWKTVYITASTQGTGIMGEIGFTNIVVQYSTDHVNWSQEKTVANQLAEDTDLHELTGFSVPVNGGYYYRVTLKHYAKEDTWWFPDTQTINGTSNYVWVSG